MSKYSPLGDRLNREAGTVTMTFDQVADLVGGLPASAFQHEAW